MSLSDWIGSVVSIDCGDVLGTYQGHVADVDQDTQSISITNGFRNGMKCVIPKITINAGDIKDLKIISSQDKLGGGPGRRKGITRKSPESANYSNPSNVCDKPKNSFTASADSFKRGSSPTKPNGYKHQNGSVNGQMPSKYTKQENGYHQNGYPENGSHQRLNGVLGKTRDTYTDGRRRTNSECEPRRRQPTTPRKIESQHPTTNGALRAGAGGSGIGGNLRLRGSMEEAFSTSPNSYDDDFDIQKNLALFDKKAIFEEIESSGVVKVVKAGPRQPANYRHDENVLASGPVIYRQIRVPQNNGKEYVTDCGLVVPAIKYDLRRRLVEAAEGLGFNVERQIEMIGRSACEMVMQLLGGAHRLHPKNAHQRPQVVVLAGPHLQGAMGVNLARQLANHHVCVTLFVPKFLKMEEHLETELQIFECCDGVKTSSAKDLPEIPVEMVVNSLDSHENQGLQHQPWYTNVVAWTKQGKAPVLDLDPPTTGGVIEPKWSLGVGLPLALPDRCGQVYLADMGLPSKVYSQVGIKYSSPFGHKFFIALHPPAAESAGNGSSVAS